MILFYVVLSFFLLIAEGGELLIVKSPLSINFKGDDTIDQDLIPEVCSAALGFTAQQDSSWNGMTISDPFNYAEAVIVLYVDGVESLGKHFNLQKYSLNNNEEECVTWKKMKNKVMDRYPVENNTMVKLELGGNENLDAVKVKYLNKNIKEDVEFMEEISSLNNVIKSIKISKGVPDLYWFSLKSLHQIIDLKGPLNPSTVEAKEMVYDALLKLGKIYSSAYNGKALVLGLVSDASHTRRTRSLTDEKQEIPVVNNADTNNIYDPDFPIIFNIILWFSVSLVFSLLAVSVFIASMDPGRDSIIYRMTSNRMKKDS